MEVAHNPASFLMQQYIVREHRAREATDALPPNLNLIFAPYVTVLHAASCANLRKSQGKSREELFNFVVALRSNGSFFT
jgi:hypothetical protein